MKGFFSFDGGFYKIGNIVFNIILLHLLWLICSIPIFTIGASTTGLFYATGKMIREEDNGIIKDFFRGFKTNFKQGTIIGLILTVIISIVITNILNLHLMGKMSIYMVPIQFIILIEAIFISIYIFPLISRHNITIKNAFITSLVLANKHFITTLLCVFSFMGILLISYKLMAISLLSFMGVYSYITYLPIQKVFLKYAPAEEVKTYSSPEEKIFNDKKIN